MDDHSLLNIIHCELQDLRTKLCMPNGVTQIKNARFYLPNFPEDCIQQCMVRGRDYWDTGALYIIDRYLKEGAVILDIGANIGSHSVFWALERNAKKIYSFEPLKGTYEILLKNIELNELENVIFPFNVGLSDEESFAKVKTFDARNIGSTSFAKSKTGNFKLVTLDSMDIKEKIDLIKIDVEGHEVEVLMGGLKTISKNKPVIVIESFHRKVEIDTIFNELQYTQVATIREGEDYIYQYTGK